MINSDSLDQFSNTNKDFINLIELEDFNSYKEYIHSMSIRKNGQTHGWQTIKCRKCDNNLNNHKMSYTTRYCSSNLCNNTLTTCPVKYKIFECLNSKKVYIDVIWYK